ncbi:MAG: VOC family protein [Acidimicrobiales bacterium]|nr:VOC family protein [Acidimicrobiales bacterium]
MNNRNISHIDIVTKDQAVTSQFYSETFGWNIQTIEMPGENYNVWQSGNIRGGFPNIDDNNKIGGVTVYLDSDDIDADLAKVEANGGNTVMHKIEIPNVGWYAYFTDPTGNRLGLFTRKK